MRSPGELIHFRTFSSNSLLAFTDKSPISPSLHPT
jgi:hypothetical protein